jgi:diguanylate cyclase (GGDEF)-like protein/PAS domain S-box-containing protein
MFNRLRACAQTTTVLGVAMIVLIWSGVVFLSGSERDHAYEAGLRQGNNLTRIFEAYISQVVKGTDSALLALRESYEHNPRDFDLMRSVDDARLQNDLVVQFVTIGRDGFMKRSTLVSSGPPVDLSDRDHFRYQARATTDEIFISPPVVGRVSGKATVQLARKLRAPDGSFDGVIIASLDILQIAKFYNSIDVGRSGTIALVGFDGIIRARSSRQHDAEGLIGRSIARSRLFQVYRKSPADSYWTSPDFAAQMDGIPRLISYRVVEGLPLIAIVALAKDDILEQAALRTNQYRQVGLGLTAFVLVVIGFGAIRQMRLASTMAALESSKQSLGQTNLRFNAALENMAHALCMFDDERRLIVCNKRYGEMYGLTPEQTRPGTTLRSILEARVAAGRSPEDGEAYIAGRLEEVARSGSYYVVNKLRGGRVIAVSHEPLASGGWVAVHQDITEQHLAEQRLNDARYELIAQRYAIDQAVIVAITDVKGRITYANDVFCRISGYSREELVGYDHRILNSGTHPPEFFGAMYRQIAHGEIWRGEVCNKAKNGSPYWVDTTIVPQLDQNGRPMSYMAIRIDITARKAAENALRESQREVLRKSQQLELALANISQGICMFDAEQKVVVRNELYASMYGLSLDDTKPGTTLREILDRRIENGIYARNAADDYLGNLLASVTRPTHEVLNLNDGRAISIFREPIPGGGWVTTHQDITERRRVEAQIMYIASHDVLTGLANRAVLHEHMGKAVARLQQDGDPFTILMLDLDRFKSVNDSLGHPVGDGLLKAVAGRLSACARETDVVARLGGDEFAVLMTAGKDQRASAIIMAERLLEAVAAPYDIDGHEINIGTSIGIALAPEHGAEVDRAIKNADLALYKAKSHGRNTYCLFDISMAVAAEDRHALEIDLRNALTQDEDEFELHYHPIVDIQTLEAVGVECLARWRHPQRGLIAPDGFIPLAEETGLINPLGEWVLRKACIDAVNWPPHIKVAVNLSPAQFQGGDLVEIVSRALTESGFPPERLELEITESILMQRNAENLKMLHQLKGLGISIVLDDFGTGYSSLSYLLMFPFDSIKIDRSFVKDLSTNADCAAIVAAVAGLGHGLNVDTVAEGVETEDQLTLVRASGCTRAQGFLFGKPCPASELEFGRFDERKQSEKAA